MGDFKTFDKLISRFMGTNLGQDLTKGIGAMMDTAGKIWETLGPILVKLLEGLLDVISGPMMAVLWLISAVYDKVRPYLLQMVEGVLAIVDKLKGMWNWLMDAIPGARKEEARIALERQAKREGLAISPAGSIVKADRFGQPTKTIATGSERLQELQARYNALPGFAEGIADAVKAGLSGLGDIIADRIAEKMPDFSPLTNAIGRLASIFGEGKSAEFAKDRHKALREAGYKMEVIAGEIFFTDLNGQILTGDELKTANQAWEESGKAAGHASGLTFTGTGTYFGKFHGPEEVLSQAATIRGPGIIARAMDALDGAAARSASGASQGTHTSIAITPTVKVDLTGARFSSDVDIDKMLDKMSRQMESVALKTVTRAIGQGRT